MRRFNRWYDALPEPTRFLVAMALISPISAIGVADRGVILILLAYALLLATIRLRR